MKKIYYLMERGNTYLYHFIIFNLGGLANIILNIESSLTDKSELSYPWPAPPCFSDKSKLISKELDEKIKDIYPIPIYMKCKCKFQQEAFEIISDKFTLITDISHEKDYCIKQIYGVRCTEASNYIGDNLEVYVPFLRNLFLSRIHNRIFDKKMIYIMRGGKIRCVLNEEELITNVLKKYNIQNIRLEDYSFEDKIRLFNSASLVISPLSSALTFSIFANEKTRILELRNKGRITPLETGGFGFKEPTHHYSSITDILNLSYHRYSNFVEDPNGNFKINTEDFDKYLEQILQ